MWSPALSPSNEWLAVRHIDVLPLPEITSPHHLLLSRLPLLQVRTLIQREMGAALQQYDALLCPAAPTPAYRIGEKTSDPLAMYKGGLPMLQAIPAVHAVHVVHGVQQHATAARRCCMPLLLECTTSSCQGGACLGAPVQLKARCCDCWFVAWGTLVCSTSPT